MNTSAFQDYISAKPRAERKELVRDMSGSSIANLIEPRPERIVVGIDHDIAITHHNIDTCQTVADVLEKAGYANAGFLLLVPTGEKDILHEIFSYKAGLIFLYFFLFLKSTRNLSSFPLAQKVKSLRAMSALAEFSLEKFFH